MAALNYTETLTYRYQQHLVSPSVDFDTIARNAGTWEVILVNCEWCSPQFIRDKVASFSGYVVEMGQPVKPDEAVDMLNVTITARRRVA